ncbi:MAG: glutamate-1-semialdehyde 2,1-aminomutase [Bacteroidota bacterium]|nr:glutamate-1-semialdehyde 2,1-aminomutase [Bacteroidota bacterium]
MNIENSIKEYARAKRVLPGGVNSPVRAFKSVKGNPIYIADAKGSKIEDIDGNIYIDYVGSWGPLILGHAPDPVINAIKKAAEKGTSFGAPTVLETEIAELICKMIPSIEMVRMVNSGTEATMSALRLARGFTGRELLVKFEGCYHGHGDSFLIKAGSGAMTFGLPDSPGVTKGTAKDTISAKYNDLEGLEQIFIDRGKEIAAVIIEPVVGNMGVVIPQKGFLEGVRKLTEQYGAILIFDEVMTGFRLAKGGAQELFNITPDITTLGKIIGGGVPVGAYGGRREIMEMLAPAGPVYQAGTLSGNPLAMAAGYTTLKILDETPSIYTELERRGAMLEAGLRQNLEWTGIKGIVNRVGSMISLFFTNEKAVNSLDDAMKSNTELYAKYFRLLLENGIYLAPSQYEATFLSAAHSDEDIQLTLVASLEAMEDMQKVQS